MPRTKVNSDEKFYQKQAKANKAFFENDRWSAGHFELLAKERKPKSLKGIKGKVYEITCFTAYNVVALLTDIVNSDDWTPSEAFYMLIRGQSVLEDVQQTVTFRLTCRRTDDQPGNGIIEVKRGEGKFHSSKYEELNGKLEDSYGIPSTTRSQSSTQPDPSNTKGTKTFASDMRRLFENNGVIRNVPDPTAEAYLMLLFEIARRLVKVKVEDGAEKKPVVKTERGEEFDELPIGFAIARALMLLEENRRGQHSIRDLVLPTKDKFHCFSDEPEDRKNAILRLNNASNKSAVSKNELRRMFGEPTTITAVAAAAAEASQKEAEAKEEKEKAANTEDLAGASRAEEAATKASQEAKKLGEKAEKIARSLSQAAVRASKESKKAREKIAKASSETTTAAGTGIADARKMDREEMDRRAIIAITAEKDALKAAILASAAKKAAANAKLHAEEAARAAKELKARTEQSRGGEAGQGGSTGT